MVTSRQLNSEIWSSWIWVY